MSGLDERESDAEGTGERFKGMIGLFEFISPSGGGEFGSVVEDEAVYAESFGFWAQGIVEEIDSGSGLSVGIDFCDGETGMDVNSEEMIDRSDAFDPSDTEGIEAKAFAGVLDLEVVLFCLFSGAFEFRFCNDLAVLYARPLDAQFSFVETMSGEHAVDAGVSDGDEGSEFVCDALRAVCGMFSDIVEDMSFVLERRAIMRQSIWLFGQQSIGAAFLVSPESFSESGS
jgi:hypothetical protein